jgi:hypothetical protein
MIKKRPPKIKAHHKSRGIRRWESRWNAHAGDVGWGGDGPPPAEFGEGRFADCHWDWCGIRDRIRDDN